MIAVEKQNEKTFEVTVEESGSASHHTVTVEDDYYQKLTGGDISKEELVERSFEFLLQRESKESILSRFDLPTINRYFPEYEDEISC
ncbi:MAG: hypothetical protein ACLFWL_12150 [Candidatus Brocadiia bacterium]